MYTPSKHFVDFHLAGFSYWDGAKIIGSLSPGDKLDLKVEPENPYDPEAVALYKDGNKLGYIPSDRNSAISQLLFFGHDIFEAYVFQIDPTAHLERQVKVTVMIKDAR